MNEDIQQLIANRQAHQGADWGDTKVDDVLKEELLRRIIYTESGSISVGTQVVGTQQMDRLGVEFTYPDETTAEYPVAQDSTTDRRRIQWNDFSIRLKKAQARFFLSDGAKLEGMGDRQLELTRRRTAEALARRKDENIVGTLGTGAYSENSSTVSNAWNLDAGDVIEDLWAMWNDIMVNAPLNNMDIREMSVLLPAEIWTETNKLELINDIQQRTRDYLGQAFGFSLYPHKLGMHEDDQVEDRHGFNPQDTAIMLIPGDDTAVHGELSASAASSAGVPLVEGPEREFGQGEDYLISQWFNTSIMSHETGTSGESPRIAVRHGVNDNEDQPS